MAYTRRRKVYRRKSTGRRYKKAGAMRRTLRGSEYYNNPLGLLGLRRHYTGSSGGPKRRGFIRDTRRAYASPISRDGTHREQLGRYFARSTGRVLGAGLSLLGVPSEIATVPFNWLGDVSTANSFADRPAKWSKETAMNNDLIQESRDDGVIRSGNKSLDTLLSFMDGDKRDTYVNLSPEQAVKGIKFASNVAGNVNDYVQSNPEPLEDLLDGVSSIYDRGVEAYAPVQEYLDWRNNGRLYDQNYLPDDRTYLEKYSPSVLLDLLSPNRKDSFESTPVSYKRQGFFEKNLDRAANLIPEYFSLDRDETTFTPVRKKKSTKIRLPTPVPEKRFGRGNKRVVLVPHPDPDDPMPDLFNEQQNTLYKYV